MKHLEFTIDPKPFLAGLKQLRAQIDVVLSLPEQVWEDVLDPHSPGHIPSTLGLGYLAIFFNVTESEGVVGVRVDKGLSLLQVEQAFGDIIKGFGSIGKPTS